MTVLNLQVSGGDVPEPALYTPQALRWQYFKSHGENYAHSLSLPLQHDYRISKAETVSHRLAVVRMLRMACYRWKRHRIRGRSGSFDIAGRFTMLRWLIAEQHRKEQGRHMKEYSFYIGIFAGICTSISLLPQLIKILKEKKAEDISFIMLFILLTGLAGWIWYGVLQEDYPLIITNGFSFLVNTLVIFFAAKYKRK